MIRIRFVLQYLKMILNWWFTSDLFFSISNWRVFIIKFILLYTDTIAGLASEQVCCSVSACSSGSCEDCKGGACWRNCQADWSHDKELCCDRVGARTERDRASCFPFGSQSDSFVHWTCSHCSTCSTCDTCDTRCARRNRWIFEQLSLALMQDCIHRLWTTLQWPQPLLPLVCQLAPLARQLHSGPRRHLMLLPLLPRRSSIFCRLWRGEITNINLQILCRFTQKRSANIKL